MLKKIFADILGYEVQELRRGTDEFIGHGSNKQFRVFALNLPKNQLTQMTEEALDELYRRLNEEFHIKPEDCPIFYLYDRDFLSYKRNELRKKYVMRYTDPYGDEDGNLGQLWIVTWRVRKLTGFSFYSRMVSENGRSVYEYGTEIFYL